MKPVHFALQTACSPAECVSRLTAAIDPGWPSDDSQPPGSKPVIGSVGHDKIHLCKRIGYHNSYQNTLRATLQARDGGTLVVGRCAIDRTAFVLACVFFAGLAVMVAGHWFSVLRQARLAQSWDRLLLGPGLLLAVWLIYRLCRWPARGETRFLLAFVTEVLQAQPVDPPSSRQPPTPDGGG